MKIVVPIRLNDTKHPQIAYYGNAEIELTDDQILAIGDEYAKLKREHIFKNKDCKDCIHYEGEDYPCDMGGCTSENKRRWRYRGGTE